MNLREYYNTQIISYFERHKILYEFKTSRFSDYYYILNIPGRDKHTLKIRISNHHPIQDYELPFLRFYYHKWSNFPKKTEICNKLGAYIAKYKVKIAKELG
jgi:hypothetical protein